MRVRLQLLTLLGAGLLALPALAQTPEKPADEPPAGDPAMKQKILDVFDTNKDGNLDRAERQAMRRAMAENFGGGPGGPGAGDRGPAGRRRPDGPPQGEGRGPEGRRGRGPDDGPGDRGPRGPRPGEGRGPDGRGPEGFGPGGPDGRPPGPPDPERMFNRFDEDKDGSLSKDEFMEFTRFMRERMAMRPPMMGRGRGPEGRGGFEGPPPRGEFERRGGEGRRRGWREGPPGPRRVHPRQPMRRRREPIPKIPFSAASTANIECPLAPGLVHHGSQPARGRASFFGVR